MRRLAIDPTTRLEGHARIEVMLDDHDRVANVYLQVPELRGFEQFCVGRPIEEVARIVTRICGVCPTAHHLAAAKAMDAVYAVKIPDTARKLRELLFSVYYVYDHTLHFFYLAAPDLVLGPDAPAAARNVIGLLGALGAEAGKRVLEHRRYAQEMQILIGGKSTHPVWCLPGGVSKGISRDDVGQLKEKGRRCYDFAQWALQLFDECVLKTPSHSELFHSDAYRLEVGDMGLVDERNQAAFYDGRVRVRDASGRDVAVFAPSDYLSHIAEHVEPYTYLKYPYLKARGWSGLLEGPDSSIYRVGPLARANVADGMPTPRAQEHYERMMAATGKPAHQVLATHWARLIELLSAAERWLELVEDDEISSPLVHTIPREVPREGVGVVEAPRGTLLHHYATDERGIATRVNLIVGTTHNHGAISMSVRKAAQALLDGRKELPEGLLNRVEMALRAYDPCFSCATHSLAGQMRLDVLVRDAWGHPRYRSVRE